MYFENYLYLNFSNFNLWFKYLNRSIISSLGYKFLVEKRETKSFSNVLGLKASSRHVTRLPICEKGSWKHFLRCLVCNLKRFLMDQRNSYSEQKRICLHNSHC